MIAHGLVYGDFSPTR